MKLLNQMHRLAGLLLVLTLLSGTLFSSPQLVVQAQSPETPEFQVSTVSTPSGDSTIVSQQAVLEGDYFATAGTLTNAQATAAGITLHDGNATGSYESAPLQSPLGHTTDMVLTWVADIPAGGDVTVAARFSTDGQTWEAWLPVPVEYQQAEQSLYAGPLVWVDRAAVYAQFKLTLQRGNAGDSPVVRQVTVVFNNTSEGPNVAQAVAKAQEQLTGLSSAGSCPKPNVISRTAWGCPDGQRSPRWPAQYRPATHIVINHTATPNTAADWARVVRSIWNYHANTLKWGDTSYHYLIDPLGHIYEGRAGGDDVIGANDGPREGAFDIAYIGCYGNCDYLGIPNAQPSTAMLEAGNALMTWKASQKGLDPLGQRTYCGKTMPNIIARSELACRPYSHSPGDNLRAKLPWMRTEVQKGVANCAVTVANLYAAPASTSVALNQRAETQIRVANIAGLYGIHLRVTFDPAYVRVVDADASQTGVQVALGTLFAGREYYIARNVVDNRAGVIEFRAALRAPTVPFSGDTDVIAIQWEGVQRGTSALEITEAKLSDRDGWAIAYTKQHGTIVVEGAPSAHLRGRILLQGRADHSGTVVFALNTPCLPLTYDSHVRPSGQPDATTDAQGRFSIAAGTYQCLLAVQSGYLVGQHAAPQGDLGTLTLLGGDVNGDCKIDILDLARIASNYGSAGPPAVDINGDGKVDIFDLTIASGNYGQRCVLDDWRP